MRMPKSKWEQQIGKYFQWIQRKQDTINLREKIGLKGKSASREIILCLINGMLIGLRPDKVLDIHEIPDSEIKNVPSSLKGEIESKYMKGIVKLKEKYIIIDIKELI